MNARVAGEGESAPPPVAAALVNWNGWRDTIACLETLAHVSYPALHLYLCDNASSDDSVERIVAWARASGWDPVALQHSPDRVPHSVEGATSPPARLTVICNNANTGFAGGTNVAMQYALAVGRRYPYLWALNTDTLVDSDAVRAAVAALETDASAGSAQSLLRGYPNDGVLDSAGIRMLWRGGSVDLLRGRPLAELAGAEHRRSPIEIFGCCGASAFYRVTALREVGLFDEGLFQTNEDVDLACRLRRAGYRALLVPESVVRHKGGVSRRRLGGRMWYVAHSAKLRVVARWWPRGLALPGLVFGAVRAFVAMCRTPGVRASEWIVLVRTLWHEYCDSATGHDRRRVFAAGRRGFLT